MHSSLSYIQNTKKPRGMHERFFLDRFRLQTSQENPGFYCENDSALQMKSCLSAVVRCSPEAVPVSMCRIAKETRKNAIEHLSI